MRYLLLPVKGPEDPDTTTTEQLEPNPSSDQFNMYVQGDVRSRQNHNAIQMSKTR